MPKRPHLAAARRHEHHDCPACHGIAVLQEKWVLHIVHSLLDGPKGFNAIGRSVGGCNPATLTHRLARLESLGLITKVEHDEGDHRPMALRNGRSCYRLTDAGRRLESVISAIRTWASEHLDDPAGR